MHQRITSALIHLILGALLLLPGKTKGEKLFVSSDRDLYIAGDHLFFSVLLSGSPGRESGLGYIMLTGPAGNRVFKGMLKFNEQRAFGSIYLTDTLVTGLYQLVAFTNTMRNSGPLSYERKTVFIANRFDQELTGVSGLLSLAANPAKAPETPNPEVPVISLSKREYIQREKITFSVKIPENHFLNPISLAVRQKSPVSFLPETGEEPLITVPDPCRYLPEEKGIILQGKLLDQYLSPSENSPIFLSCSDTLPNLQHTKTGPGGLFRFFLNPSYFGKTIYVKSEQNFKGTIITDDKYPPVQVTPSSGISISGDVKGFLEKSQKFLSIQKSYPSPLVKQKKKTASGTPFLPQVYYHADRCIYPAEFTFLPSFVEISREIIPYLKTRGNRDGYVASVVNLNLKEYTDTYIFVDGVLIEDVNQIIHFNSDIIRKIEVLPHTRFLGELIIPGIVSINTKTGESAKISWKHPVVKMTCDTLMPASFYRSQEQELLPHHIPDFRQLLLWEPEPARDKPEGFTFETFASDCTGEFEVILYCVNENGSTTEFKSSFYVHHP